MCKRIIITSFGIKRLQHFGQTNQLELVSIDVEILKNETVFKLAILFILLQLACKVLAKTITGAEYSYINVVGAYMA